WDLVVVVGILRQSHRLRVAPEIGNAIRALPQVSLEDRPLIRAQFAGEVVREEPGQLPARQLSRGESHEAAPSARAPSRLPWGPAVTHAKSFAKQRSRVQSRATRTFFSRR